MSSKNIARISSLIVCLLISVSTVNAASISYEFRICENLNVLQNPNNATLQAQAVQVNQQQMSLARDMPYFQLINTSTDATASLTTYRLAIDPDRPFNFDLASLISASPGITYVLNGLDAVQNGLRNSFIDITFSGFTPGKSVIFRTDIDRSTGDVNQLTDYRNVLFTPNSAGTTQDNASLTVGFNNNSLLTTTHKLPNFTTDGPVLTCICFRETSQVDSVTAFSVAQVVAVPVPEPGVWMLIGMAAIGGVITLRRRRAA